MSCANCKNNCCPGLEMPQLVGEMLYPTMVGYMSLSLPGPPADVKAYLNNRPFYPNDTAARLAGLTTGDHYKYSQDTDTGIYGVIKEVTPL